MFYPKNSYNNIINGSLLSQKLNLLNTNFISTVQGSEKASSIIDQHLKFSSQTMLPSNDFPVKSNDSNISKF